MFGFKQIISTLASDKYQVTKYQSEKTSLTVIISPNEDPTVQCSILIVTEPENDEGCTHALEHLIFNGSQRYPCRNVLNKLDVRVTVMIDVDHTIFGFSSTVQDYLRIVPVFLDYIMFPLLSEEDYVLDIHHIDGEGNDGGLVYEEMKTVFQSPYKRVVNKLLKEMYPNSAYSYDYCGTESALRLSSNNSKVKEFHKKYYQPENVTILLTGKINPSEIFKILSEFDDEIIAKRVSDPVNEWVKPWQTIPSHPNYGEYNSFHSINYPDVNGHEKDGYMLFGWRGPVITNATALKELAACEILLDYLSCQSCSPLHKWLVDIKEPLAGIVSSNVDSLKVSLLRLELFDIPMDKMEQAKCKTLEYIRNIRTGLISLDMDRITDLLKNELKEDYKDMKWVHHNITTKYLISLYLETDDEFTAAMNPQWHLNQLSKETVDYWLGTFRKYFTDDLVIANGIPIELENREIEEKQRIDKQRETLGVNGLAEKARILESAKKYREVSSVNTTHRSIFLM